ncbi:hypothetical protein O2W15_17135 [Modestobacter sp. VKM Ac-2979]|uniref:hypothetical protein n=1 Tax=unclassified Modestobacter TaxID=2643866 RepID=UPI0022AB8823|nr:MULTISPECIES: hypothetical protein [unclassified Modestobacter]MCZ2813159.1 hypothetical protein [Modestobacter sp. VKM Ac-2979]MCZ2842812.1 hypothetical protein [Modestobacter sp. VKM Ac-2980]
MLEEVRAIPRALASHPADDSRSVARAIRWFLQAAERVGGQPLLLVPRRNFDGFDRPLVDLSKRIQTETWKTFTGCHWPGGPVLAAWPDRDQVAKLDADRRTSALCVLIWSERDVAAWSAAHLPEMLSPTATPPSPSTVSDPAVERGLETVTTLINQSNGLTGYGRDIAVTALLTLHDAGYQLDPEEIYAWTLSKGWRPMGAAELRDFATAINRGTRPRAHRPALRADILDVWRSDAGALPKTRQTRSRP